MRMTEKLAIHGGKPAVFRPPLPFSSISSAERDALTRFMDKNLPLSGFHGSARPSFFGGQEVLAFEAAWQKRFGSAHVISMNSATSGLIAALGAVGIGPGDEVIVPPYSMSASAIAPVFYGGIPVFADIDPDYFCLSVESVEKALTPATRAIIAVNLFGHPADLKGLRALADKRGIHLIEDSAQATLAVENGKTVGTIGHIGIYSLNIHKHIQTGEGGVCVTADAELAKRLQLIRNHGENVTEWLGVNDLTNLVGFNFRMTEMAASIGTVQLARIDELVDRVVKTAQRLTEGTRNLEGLTVPAVREGCSHNYYMWSLKFDTAALGCSREAFSAALTAEGFPNAVGYVKPIYWLPMFERRIAIGREGFPFNLRNRQYPRGLCPVTERMHISEILQYQPVSWQVDDAQVEMMIEAIHKVHPTGCKPCRLITKKCRHDQIHFHSLMQELPFSEAFFDHVGVSHDLQHRDIDAHGPGGQLSHAARPQQEGTGAFPRFRSKTLTRAAQVSNHDGKVNDQVMCVYGGGYVADMTQTRLTRHDGPEIVRAVLD